MSELLVFLLFSSFMLILFSGFPVAFILRIIRDIRQHTRFI